MNNEVVPVEIREILPASEGAAVFIGNDEKVFVIQMDAAMGAVIDAARRGVPKERPLTHDLMGLVFKGFGITVERVVITSVREGTYLARIILKQENQLGTKLVEIDARPSDCLALASAGRRPMYVARALFHAVADMSGLLAEIHQMRAEQDGGGAEGEEEGEAGKDRPAGDDEDEGEAGEGERGGPSNPK
jgi:bifunctional DNase/RNase